MQLPFPTATPHPGSVILSEGTRSPTASAAVEAPAVALAVAVVFAVALPPGNPNQRVPHLRHGLIAPKVGIQTANQPSCCFCLFSSFGGSAGLQPSEKMSLSFEL